MIVVGFDPGETTGWAALDADTGRDATFIGMGQVRYSNLIETLEEMALVPDVVVIEIFQLLPHKAQKMAGSKFLTIEAQGMIRSWARRHGAKEVNQKPTIKPSAEKFTQVKAPSNHAHSHQIDAFNHAKYWLITNGHDRSQLEKQEGSP
jgi:hypothetical protein